MKGLNEPGRPLFERLQALGDETRARLLLLLEEHEMTVSELCAVLQLPQSTVSRHLKVLTDDGWLRSRAVGTSRYYRMGELDAGAAELWRVVRASAGTSVGAGEDGERARAVLARRREQSRVFFSRAAARWDRLREELFGGESEWLPLLGLLERWWQVADLGAGTGALSVRLAPHVKRVIAVDGSAEMLAALAERAAERPEIEARRGELETLPIESDAVDVAFLVLALHYVVEPWVVLAEAKRVLVPGGRLVVVDMREHDREAYRSEMGHVWLGFTEQQVLTWCGRAGLVDVRYTALAPDPDAKGPRLFVATMRKPG